MCWLCVASSLLLDRPDLGMSYFWSPAAQASLQDDRFDGNIFALYAGNGSLVPPRMPLSQAIAEHRPSLLVFYLDDSRDCKQFASVVSQLQAPYGRAVEFIPVNADTLLGDRPKINRGRLLLPRCGASSRGLRSARQGSPQSNGASGLRRDR